MDSTNLSKLYMYLFTAVVCLSNYWHIYVRYFLYLRNRSVASVDDTSDWQECVYLVNLVDVCNSILTF